MSCAIFALCTVGPSPVHSYAIVRPDDGSRPTWPFEGDVDPALVPDTLTDPHEGADTEPEPDLPQTSVKPVRYGTKDLPEPVRLVRDRLLAAAASGDIDALRPIFDQPGGPPAISFDPVEDPVERLRLQSGDAEGREILAILIDLLEAGWVISAEGTSQEVYLWPYFADYPLDTLSPAQEVELYRILTAIDVEEMRRIGAYAFYRIGIGADGRIRYFTANAF